MADENELSYEQLETIESVREEALSHLECEITGYRDFLDKRAQHLRDEFEVWFDAEIDRLSETLRIVHG